MFLRWSGVHEVPTQFLIIINTISPKSEIAWSESINSYPRLLFLSLFLRWEFSWVVSGDGNRQNTIRAKLREFWAIQLRKPSCCGRCLVRILRYLMSPFRTELSSCWSLHFWFGPGYYSISLIISSGPSKLQWVEKNHLPGFPSFFPMVRFWENRKASEIFILWAFIFGGF